MNRSRPVLTVLAAIVAITGILPFSLLVADHSWVPGTMLFLAIVMISGILARTYSDGPGVVLLSQLLALGIVSVVVLTGQGIMPHRWFDHIGAVFFQAQETLLTSTAPVPATSSVITMMVLGNALIALVVDYVAVTARMPALAGIPVVVPFILAASATTGRLHVGYFIFAALAWAALVAFTGSLNDYRTPGTRIQDLPFMGTVVGLVVAGLLAALFFAPLVPQRDDPLSSRQISSAQALDSSVDFSKDLKLFEVLNSRNFAPVLTYSSSDDNHPPLRVTVSSRYSKGTWKADLLQGARLKAKNNDTLDLPPGMYGSVPHENRKITVMANGLPAPLVALPAPVVNVNFGDTNWTLSALSHVPIVDKAPSAYAANYMVLPGTTRPASDEKTTTVWPGVSPDDLQTDPSSAAAIRAVLPQVTAGANTKFDKAIKIQQWLRSKGGFTYALQVPKNEREGNAALIKTFLAKKRGYCTHFASAMVMMARAEGIPARLAVGFLPGEAYPNGLQLVRARDAHAWPELYFAGLGWLRFEPTPAIRSGSPPAYAPDAAATPSASPSSTPTPSTSTPTPTPSTSSTSTDPQNNENEQQEVTAASNFWSYLLWLFGALVVFGLVPLAGWRMRNKPLYQAESRYERNEAVWERLAWKLRDLRIEVPSGLSPRGTAAAVAANPLVDNQNKKQIDRVLSALESSRYGEEGGRPIAGSADNTYREIARSMPWHRRLLATLLPVSGLTYLRNKLKALRWWQ